MITSTVNVIDHFADVTSDVEALAVRALNDAARAGAQAAEEAAAPGLKQHAGMDVIPAHGDVDGFSSGFRSPAKGKRGQPIGTIHDTGTYGKYKGRNTPRRRARAQKVAAVNPETGKPSGIEAREFKKAGRRAGRRVLKSTIQRGL